MHQHGLSAGRHRIAIGAVALAIALVAATPGAWAPVRAADPIPTTTTLPSPSLNPKPVGRPTALVATVSPATTGSVEFYDDATLVATVEVNENSMAVYYLPADAPTGSHPMRATFLGNATYAGSTSATMIVEVGPRPVTVEVRVSGPHEEFGATAQQGDGIHVSAWAIDPELAVFDGSFTVALDGVVVGSMTVAEQVLLLQTTGWSIGAHALVVRYDPGSSTEHAPGDSPPFAIQIVANVVEAFVSRPSNPTFYPVKDGYLDTTVLRGGRDEKASVVVRVYSPAGRLVKKASFAAATGPWSLRWNGRTASGSLLPAGVYTVRSVATDSLGATRRFEQHVTLSHKRLYTQTITLTKRYTKAAKRTPSWLAWTFTLPAAPIYRSLTFSIYGRDLVGSGGFGPHDYTRCAGSTWDPSCAQPYRSFPTSYTWVSVRGDPRYNRSGRVVRLYAWGGSGRTTVVSGRVRVVYGYLR